MVLEAPPCRVILSQAHEIAHGALAEEAGISSGRYHKVFHPLGPTRDHRYPFRYPLLGAGLPRKQADVDGSSSSGSELPVLPTRTVIWMHGVSTFVGDDIVDQMRRRAHKIPVEHEVPGCRVAAPSAHQCANDRPRFCDAEAQERARGDVQSLLENGAALQRIPALEGGTAVRERTFFVHRQDQAIAV